MNETAQPSTTGGPAADNPNVMTARPRGSRRPQDVGFLERR
jgi:catalase